MIGQTYKNFPEFYKVLESELFDDNKWRDVNFMELRSFISLNFRLILEQTQNDTNAHDLKEKLLKLSNKINEKFTKPFTHNLAFEIMGLAQGIFSKEEEKNDYTSLLPSEIRRKIYAELNATTFDIDRINKGLGNVRLVSKSESQIAKETKIACLNNPNVSLNESNCKTLQQAIEYIQNNKNLYYANLLEFNLTNEDLIKLQDCTWIQHLSIESSHITSGGLKFLKGMSLKSVDFSNCDKLTDKALEYLKDMPLESINFSGCYGLTDKALEYLKKMPLRSVNFSHCYKLTDKALEYLKDMPLESINFSSVSLLTDEALEYLKEMQLQSVNFNHCHLLTDKALEHIKEMPLKSVEFSCCNLLSDKALEFLKGRPLQEVRFSGCNQLTDNAIEYLREIPLRSIDFMGCNLTDKALTYLNRMSLEFVSLEDCNQITGEALAEFREHFFSLGRFVVIFR